MADITDEIPLEQQVRTLEAALDMQNTQTAVLREQLDGYLTMFAQQDVGWMQFNGDMIDTGPSLMMVKEWSMKLREGLANVHIRNGLRLRTNYIWGGGIDYGTLPTGSGNKPVQKWVNDSQNQANFFGRRARNERESGVFTDGIVLYRGRTDKDGVKRLTAIPLRQIVATMRNPERMDQIWAYKRQYVWNDGNGNERLVREWFYVDTFFDRRHELKIPALKGEIVHDKPGDDVIFDLHVNTQIGHAFGCPDSFAALAWAQVYRNFMMNGKVMSDAMAQFAFQIATKSKAATTNVAAKLSTHNSAGSALVSDMQLNPISTAGKGYDFTSGRPLLAIVAAALEVSVIELSADPSGGKGGGYGTAQTLTLPERLAVDSRRQLHAEFDKRVLVWMGVPPEKLDITFAPLDDSAEMYRQLQALAMVYDRGVMKAETFATAATDLLGINGNEVPNDVIVPATKSGLSDEAKAAAVGAPVPTVPKGADSAPTTGQGFAPAPTAAPSATPAGGKRPAATTANPQQGKSSKVGKGPDGGKQGRTDILSK